MTTRAQAKDIMRYLFSIVNLSTDTIDSLTDTARLASPSILIGTSTDTIRDNTSTWGITAAERDCVIRLRAWLIKYYNDHGPLPGPIADWKTEFTGTGFTQYLLESITLSATTAGQQQAGGAGPSQQSQQTEKGLSLKLSDYLDFYGREIGEWLNFKPQFEAQLSIGKYQRVLDVVDWDLHDNNMNTDPTYKQQVNEVFQILKIKTAKGNAASYVTQYEKSLDGARAWNALKEHYDKEGDAKSYGGRLMQDLLALQYNLGSAGGFASYCDKFLRILLQIENTENQPLSDNMKKTIFLNGINVTEMRTTKDLCRDKDFTHTMEALRSKAIELGCENTPTSKRRWMKPRVLGISMAKGQQVSAARTNQNQNTGDVMYLDAKVWAKMSPEQRTLWTNIRRKGNNKLEQYGTQYGARQAKAATTKSAGNNKRQAADDTAEAQVAQKATKKGSEKKMVTAEGGNIWRPTTRRVNMARRIHISADRVNKAMSVYRQQQEQFNRQQELLSHIRYQTVMASVVTVSGESHLYKVVSFDNWKRVNVEIDNGPLQTMDAVQAWLRIFHPMKQFELVNHLERNRPWMSAYWSAVRVMQSKDYNKATNSHTRYDDDDYGFDDDDVPLADYSTRKGSNGGVRMRLERRMKKAGPQHCRRNLRRMNMMHSSLKDVSNASDRTENDEMLAWTPNIRVINIRLKNPYGPYVAIIIFLNKEGKVESDSRMLEVPYELAIELFPGPIAMHIALNEFHYPRHLSLHAWAYTWWEQWCFQHPEDRDRALSDIEQDNNLWSWILVGEYNDQHAQSVSQSLPEPSENQNRQQNIKTRFVDRHLFQLATDTSNDTYQIAYVDNASDTFGIGGQAWIIESRMDMKVNVAGYDTHETLKKDVEIGTGVTALDLPNGETVLLRANNGTLLGDNGNALFSICQMAEHGVTIDDLARRHGGLGYLLADDTVIPLVLRESMLTLKIRKPTQEEYDTMTPIDLTSPTWWEPEQITEMDLTVDQYEALCAEVAYEQTVRKSNIKKSSPSEDYKKYESFFLYPGSDMLEATIKNTTRFGSINMRIPMRQSFKSRNPLLQRRRINEEYSTDTWFAVVTSFEGYNCCQIFAGVKSKFVSQYGLLNESQGADALLDFFRQEGVPISIVRDNSKMQASNLWTDYMRRFWVKDKFIEPYHSNQNPAERIMAVIKEKMQRLMIDTGAPPEAWFLAAQHVADVHNNTANSALNGRTPFEVREGSTPDISGLVQFHFWELVYFAEKDGFPSEGGPERLAHWCGRALDYGDKMCYTLLDCETHAIIIRSMVRSAEDTERPNRGLRDLQETVQKETICTTEDTFPVISYANESVYMKGVSESGEVDSEETKHTHTPKKFDPEDLIDLYIYDVYKNRKGGETKMRGKVIEEIDKDTYRVAFDNGKQRVYDYEEIVAMANKEDEDGEERWTFDKILNHRWSKLPNRKGRIDVLVKWDQLDPSWEPMEIIKKDDPVTLAEYAKSKDLLKQSMWKWAKRYVKNDKKFKRMKRLIMASKRAARGIKYKFGVQVPRSIMEAYKLDERNGNNKWADAIKRETDMLQLYECFDVQPEGAQPPQGYQRIPLIWVFDVKFDGRHRARCVAGGHMTSDLEDDMYSGVVNLETVRIAFVAAALMELQVIAADIGSAYLNAFTSEKVYTIAGPEFGPLKGRLMIFVKAVYGLKGSAAFWHQKLADNLLEMGFVPCQADLDLWVRECNDWMEYVAVIVDDLLVFSRHPETVIEALKQGFNYELKGVGVPEYYSGADIDRDPDTGCWTMSAQTYIKGVVGRIEKLLDTTLRNYGSPMTSGDHPEIDDTDLLYGNDISIYQMLIGCAQWAVTLGRFDVQFATNTLARCAAMPRQGHLDRCLRLFGYLKHNAKARLLFDPSDPNYDDVEFKEHDWERMYPDAEEYIPDKAPKPKTRKVQITVHVDASHADCLQTRRSVTGYLISIGKTPIQWYSKRQNTIESSSYGSELVAHRIADEALLGIRYKLRMMGIDFEHTSTVLCDNEAVVLNTQLPSSSLKKKHNAVAYHRIRELVAIGVIRTGHIRSNCNIVDVLTKPKGPAEYYMLLTSVFYGRSYKPTKDSKSSKETETENTQDDAFEDDLTNEGE